MREEVELLPSGLASCLLNGKEVRILKISPESITVRLSEEADEISKLVVAFYMFKDNRYDEVNIEDFVINKKKKEEFYYTYSFTIKDKEYFQRVRNTLRDYSKYVMMKNYGYENQFSEEMVSMIQDRQLLWHRYLDGCQIVLSYIWWSAYHWGQETA